MVQDHDPYGQRDHTEPVRFDQPRACDLRIYVIALAEDDSEKTTRYSAEQRDGPRLRQRKVEQHRDPESEPRLQQILKKDSNERVPS